MIVEYTAIVPSVVGPDTGAPDEPDELCLVVARLGGATLGPVDIQDSQER